MGKDPDFLCTTMQHRAQTTKKVKDILQNECKTTLVLVPPGATSKVQPLDVAVNSEFKKAVDRLATDHVPVTLR